MVLVRCVGDAKPRLMRKKICVLPVLKDYDGDLSRDWYVEYQYRNPKNNQLKRFRIYKGLNVSSARERRKTANKIVDKYTSLLRQGYNPFEQKDELFVYDDMIDYDNIARAFGRRKKNNKALRKYLSGFLTETKQRVKAKTFESYQSKTRLFCQYLEYNGYDDHDISEINNDVVVGFFWYLINNRQLDQLTIKKYQQNLNQLFTWLIDKKIIRENPVYNIPRVQKRMDLAAKPFMQPDKELLKQEIKKRDPWLWLACLFQYYCAIRPGTELRLLKVKQINFHGQTIYITGATSKTNRNEIINIPDNFIGILKDEYQLDKYDRDYYVFGRHGLPGQEPRGKNTMRNKFNKIRDDLELPKDYKFYSWKHTGACDASEANIPIDHLRTHLRHRSLESTQHYLERKRGWRSENIIKDFPEL